LIQPVKTGRQTGETEGEQQAREEPGECGIEGVHESTIVSNPFFQHGENSLLTGMTRHAGTNCIINYIIVHSNYSDANLENVKLDRVYVINGKCRNHNDNHRRNHKSSRI